MSAALLAACALVAGLAAAFVWARRTDGAAAALAVLLAAVALWDGAYAAELLARDPGWRVALGDVKYAGIGLLTPSWLVFIARWTGRGRLVTRRRVALLLVQPAALLAALAVPATHDLVRHLPPDGDPLTAEIAVGPLFWAHLLYTDLLLLPATALFVGSLLVRSRAYWLQGWTLAVAALLPWAANLLFALSVGPFGRLDLTPVAFTLTGLVLVWGLLSQRLLRLAPVARAVLVDRMSDAVLVLDAYGHVADANPAARAVLAPGGGPVVGRRGAELLPAEALGGSGEVVLDVSGVRRTFEVTDDLLPGQRHRPAGRLLVLRDVTERAELDRRLRELLQDRARVAEQLSASLRPTALPAAPGLALAARFRPAGDGREIGGDFYDVFRAGADWAFTLGDVSGKGARAAATTAHARYTLRTLALDGAGPAAALARLHALVVDGLEDETYLTAVHGRVRTTATGATVELALGGHPQPLLLRADGRVEAVGVPGSAIGLLEQADVTACTVLLGPGDALVVSTDGISEARDGDRLWGEGGLERALAARAGRPADDLAQALLDDVLALSGGSAADDVALLVVQAAPLPVVTVPAPAPRPAVESRRPRV